MIEAKLAFPISGGTGPGKTTLLAALLALVPRQEQIVIVEDSGELARPTVRMSCESRVYSPPSSLERSACLTWSVSRCACVRTGSWDKG
jgi:type IV secretory pathway ATPase VirB11/archaellum biosynthesis ATPase